MEFDWFLVTEPDSAVLALLDIFTPLEYLRENEKDCETEVSSTDPR